MKGNNVEFKTKIVRKGTKNSTENSHNSYSGNIIDFNIMTNNTDNKNHSTISGSNLDFSATNIGKWSIKEKKVLVCMICKLPILDRHRPHRCPMCHSTFHDDHIFEWLKVKGKCPVCLQALRPGGTEEVKL